MVFITALVLANFNCSFYNFMVALLAASSSDKQQKQNTTFLAFGTVSLKPEKHFLIVVTDTPVSRAFLIPSNFHQKSVETSMTKPKK